MKLVIYTKFYFSPPIVFCYNFILQLKLILYMLFFISVHILLIFYVILIQLFFWIIFIFYWYLCIYAFSFCLFLGFIFNRFNSKILICVDNYFKINISYFSPLFFFCYFCLFFRLNDFYDFAIYAMIMTILVIIF